MVKTMVSGLDFPPLNQYRAVTLYMGKRGGKKPRDIIVRINWWPLLVVPIYIQIPLELKLQFDQGNLYL